MTKKKKRDKEIVLDGSGYTFRTFIQILQQHTSLPNSFYRRFNVEGAAQRQRQMFVDAALKREANGTEKKKKKPKKPKKEKVDVPAPSTSKDETIELLSEYLNGADLAAFGASDQIIEAYRLVETLDPATRIIERRKLRALAKLSKDDEQSILRNLHANEGLTDVEFIDIVERCLAAYQLETKILYTLGSFYEFLEKQKLWAKIQEDTIKAQLEEVVKVETKSIENPPINHIVAESIKRIKMVENGEVRFKSLEFGVAETFNAGVNDIFTNILNAQVMTGDVFLNVKNSEIRINTKRKSKSIKGRGEIEKVKRKDSIEDLLLRDVDLANGRVKGLVRVDTKRKETYYNNKMPSNYISDKELAKAIKAGKLRAFTHFLDCITKNLKPKERNEFIHAYLDTLAYIIQPIKRHNLFFYFQGNGANGKSFTMRIVEACIGSNFITSTNFDAAENNPRFFESSMAGCHIMYDDDVQNFGPKTLGLLKKYSNGNEIIKAELKGSNDRLQFQQRSSMVLSSNPKVYITDSSYGLERRIRPFHFGTRIDDAFDRYKDGDDLLDNELHLIFNVLRLRIPRVVKYGVDRTEAMQHFVNRLTRSSPVDKAIDRLKHSKGSEVSVSKIVAAVHTYYEKVMGPGNTYRLPSTHTILNMLEERGFKTNDNGTKVVNAKFKK